MKKLITQYRYQLTFTYLITVVALAVLPINGTDSTINTTYVAEKIRLDYFIHGCILVPWMLLLIGSEQVSFWSWLFYGIGLATLTEGIQYLLPYRTFSLVDLLSNVIGLFAGVLILKSINHFGRGHL